MSGILKRFAAIVRSAVGRNPGSPRDAAKPMTAPVVEALPSLAAGHPTTVVNPGSTFRPLVVVVSKPEPLSAVDPDHVPYAPHDITGTVVGETSKPAPRPSAVLKSMRHPVSPIAARKVFGRSIAVTPRRSKAAPAAPVRANRISGDSVRMQAALMRCQRAREAQRALDKLKALRPTATIHTLQRAA